MRGRVREASSAGAGDQLASRARDAKVGQILADGAGMGEKAALNVVDQGRRVRFTTLAGLANELQEAQGRRELARVVGRYARTELVVLESLDLRGLRDPDRRLGPANATGTE